MVISDMFSFAQNLNEVPTLRAQYAQLIESGKLEAAFKASHRIVSLLRQLFSETLTTTKPHYISAQV